jgi:xylulokinase
MTKLFLGVDVGTTGAKAVLFTPEGTVEAVGQAEYDTTYIRPGWVEQNPADWWAATCTAIQKALADVSDGAKRVAGVAVSGQAPSLVALDDKGEPLRPAMIWMDRRAEAEATQLADIIGADEVFKVSGNRPDAFYIAAKLRWLKNHEPETLKQTHQITLVTGFINHRLTGRTSLDPVHAALLQLRDYQTGAWSAALCEACGVSPDQFAAARDGHEILGDITREAADATGLRPGTPVMVGTVDGSAAAVEAGAVDLGSAAEMTGTSTVLLMPNDGSVTESAFIAMPHAIPGIHLLLGALVASGASLRWFRDQFGQIEQQVAAQMQADPFDLLTQEAATINPGSDGLIFLPYMMGERSPIWHTNARGVFFGLSLATPKAALIRAILEGVAFGLRHNVEVARDAGVSITEIRSVGGGSRSDLWNQIKADVLGVPVLLPEASVGAPFGDAVLVGMGLGDYPDGGAAVRKMVKLRRRYDPDMANHARYSEIYPIFRRIYEHLKTDFDDAAALMQEK